jgi:hypothetical protein
MRSSVFLLLVAGALTIALTGCGATPEPTPAPPSQTPWIIVVTATPGAEEAVEAQPTQTPWIIVATPTGSGAAKPAPTKAKATVTGEPEGQAPEQATTEPTASDTASPTAKPPAPTRTTSPSALKYPAPELEEPPDTYHVSWRSTVLLEWTSVADLDADEYYHVHIERPPTSEAVGWWGDYVYTKDTELLVEQAFLVPFHLAEEHGAAAGYWWVRVVRKTGEDDSGKPVGVDVSPPSERRILIFEPRD